MEDFQRFGFVCEDLVNQVDGLRVLGIESVAPEGNFPCMAFSNDPWQALQSSHIGDETEFGLRKGEESVLGA